MGVAIATFGLLADWVTTVQSFVVIFIYVYMLVIFAYIITSLVRVPHSLHWLQRFLYDVCEPYLRLFRKLLPPLGPIDLSPMVGVLVLIGVQQLAVRLLDQAH